MKFISKYAHMQVKIYFVRGELVWHVTPSSRISFYILLMNVKMDIAIIFEQENSCSFQITVPQFLYKMVKLQFLLKMVENHRPTASHVYPISSHAKPKAQVS